MTNRVEINSFSWRVQKNVKAKKKNIFAEIIADYFSHTGLHGIGYVGAKDTTLPEKIWWMIIFSASLSVCIYLITETYSKWKDNPVILSFDEEQTPIWAIPFPAVTVCPINKIRQTQYNYTEKFLRRNNLTKEEYKSFWDISLICNLDRLYKDDFFSTIDITDNEAIKTIFRVAPTLTHTLFQAKWQNTQDLSIFVEHVTKEGLCFTFNSLSPDDMFTKEVDVRWIKHDIPHTNWSMEDGYLKNSHKVHYPRRTAQDGYGSGLSFILYSYLSDRDYVCGLPVSGYKIILHNPVETAKAAQQYFLLSSDRTATIMIKPEMTTTSVSLKHLSAHTRKCYFSHEKSLMFFKIYTQNNCRIECNLNVTEQYCGCVPFYMPRSEKSLICGYGKMKCLEEIENKIWNFQMMEKGINMVEKEMETLEYKIFDNCDCLPACNNLQFSAEMSHAKVEIIEAAFVSAMSNNIKNISPEMALELQQQTLRASQVDIFFKESEFLALRRSERYEISDFVANCGGFLGLFLGFSSLSVIEIVYFLTLRLWCKIRHRKSSNTELQFQYPLH